MEHRPLSLAALLIALLLVGSSVLAAESGPSPEQMADWQQRLDQAAALQAEARQRQAEADGLLETKSVECRKKFLVNSCLESASREHVVASREARRLENQGKAMQREVKKEQLNDKDKRRAEEAPAHQAEMALRKSEVAAERQAADEQAAANKAAKEKKAAEGASRKAAEAEKHRRKVEEHEARVAAKKREAEQRAAGAAAK